MNCGSLTCVEWYGSDASLPEEIVTTTSKQGQPSYDRSAWEDRFNEPTLRALREPLGADALKAFDRADAALRELTGSAEPKLIWHGACWRWTLEYKFNRGRDTLAVLVPNPADLQLAAPVSEAFVESLPKRRLKRAVRDGLELASPPFDTNWAVWSLTSVSLLEEVLSLLERKLTMAADDSKKMTG